MVLSLYAGLTTGEISAHFEEIYGASVSKERISRIIDKVLEQMAAWQARPVDAVYAAIFVDAIVVKVRDARMRLGATAGNLSPLPDRVGSDNPVTGVDLVSCVG